VTEQPPVPPVMRASHADDWQGQQQAAGWSTPPPSAPPAWNAPAQQWQYGQTPPGQLGYPANYPQMPPGYPPPSPYSYGAPGRPDTGTNGFAVASLVLGLLWIAGLGSLLAVIFGHIAQSQNKGTSRGGTGLATAGLVLGYIGLALGVVAAFVAVSDSDAARHSTAGGASLKADVVVIGKDVASYYVDGSSPLTVTGSDGTFTLTDVSGNTVDYGSLSAGNSVVSSQVKSSTDWCVAVGDGDAGWKYTSADGLVAGTDCP